MITSPRHKAAAVAGGLVVLAGFLLLDGVPKTGGGRNAGSASNLNRAGKGSAMPLAGRPYKFNGKYGPNVRWGFGMGERFFEPASEGGEAFVSRGRGASLRVDANEVVLALASRQSSVLSAQFKRRPWSVVRGPSQKTTDNRLRIGLIGSPFLSPFSVQNSELSPASSPKSLASSFVRLRLVGANPNAKVIGLEQLKGKSNYFIGNDPKKWRTNVPNYARVMVKDVYPGVDQIFYGKDGQLEYDFVVHPGADPKAIRLAAETGNWKLENGNWKIENRQSKIENASDGDLLLQTDAGEVRFGKPLVYQASTDEGRWTVDVVLNSPFTIHNWLKASTR